MKTNTLKEIAIWMGFEVNTDFFCPYKVTGDTASYPLSFLETYITQ